MWKGGTGIIVKMVKLWNTRYEEVFFTMKSWPTKGTRAQTF